MPPHAVMKITGHSDYKAMQPYIDIESTIKQGYTETRHSTVLVS